MTFSERYGYKKARETIQIESIDSPLRNSLWNLLTRFVWNDVQWPSGGYNICSLSSGPNFMVRNLCEKLWFDYFKEPLDKMGNDWRLIYKYLRSYFYDCQWHEVYDFVEFVANQYERPEFEYAFITSCNGALEKENSAYRFVGGFITRITDKQEIDEIDQAIETKYSPVRVHIQQALTLMSNREAPDFRNSIKESISAVESLAKIATDDGKGTLGGLLKILETRIQLHSALKDAFNKLYGYTSDEGGIRHALMEPDSIYYEDAKFFLVACSAFINLIEAKIARLRVH